MLQFISYSDYYGRGWSVIVYEAFVKANGRYITLIQ